MTAYLIVYGIDPTDRFAAYVYATKAAARRAAKTLVPSVPVDGWGRYDSSKELRPGCGGCWYVIEKQEDITFGGKRLVEVFHALTKNGPQRFQTRDDGLRRLMEALPKFAQVETSNEQPTVTVREEHEAELIEHADSFYATAFRGQPKGFDRVECATLEEARKAARGMCTDRPVMIYAVRGGRQVHVENVMEHVTVEQPTSTDTVPLSQPTGSVEEKKKRSFQRTDKMMEEAKTGVFPEPPDFSANTHKPWRKKLEALKELVDKRDVRALREFAINPISSSPKALLRYRDCAIAAIEHQQHDAVAA